ncbi:MAG: hypothetical protein KAV87_59805 [Desulfobacteraceae bacterium]|nr:hypothetical protein [Desulfobacteraceae bacterium]
MNNAIPVALIIVFMLLALIIFPQWLMKRAIRQVIRILWEHNAFGIDNSKTIDELALRPLGIPERLFRGRDYKQYALKALMRAAIIQTTQEGRLCLSEEKLAASGLDRDASSPRQSIGYWFDGIASRSNVGAGPSTSFHNLPLFPLYYILKSNIPELKTLCKRLLGGK